MTHPIVKARLRPIIAPTLPPVIINDAITNVYIVIAVWIPVTSVPTSAATTGIDTFITELSRAITNWPAASAASTTLLLERRSDAITCGNLLRGQTSQRERRAVPPSPGSNHESAPAVILNPQNSYSGSPRADRSTTRCSGCPSRSIAVSVLRLRDATRDLDRVKRQ